ncbi:MAG: VanZ family protein [Bacteroidales bacterium]
MFLRYNLPGIVWSLIILILLGLPNNDLPDISFLNIPYFDKIVHIFLFLVFVFLLAYGFAKQNRFNILHQKFLLLSLLTGVIYGGLTEILQEVVFIERTSGFFDFIADVAGCLIGLLFFFFLKRKILPVQGK